jgi:hypothetical protein
MVTMIYALVRYVWLGSDPAQKERGFYVQIVTSERAGMEFALRPKGPVDQTGSGDGWRQ